MIAPGLLAWERARRASEAEDGAAALRWMERAHRLLPEDALVALTLGSLRLGRGDAAGAVAVLTPLVAHGTGTAPVWQVIAAAWLALGDGAGAAQAIEQALWSVVVTPELAGLAERVRAAGGWPGWCGLGADGRVVCAPEAEVSERGETFVVSGPGGQYLGSPVPAGRLRAVQGFVAEGADGLGGWAWHPGDPARDPALVLAGPAGELRLTAEALADGVEGLPPLARPRRVSVGAAALRCLGSPVAVTDGRGRHLLGSPIWPEMEPEAAAPAPPATDLRRREVDVVMPVYGDPAGTLAGLEAVLANVPPETVVHVVDDASSEPALVAALDALAEAGRIRLHRHRENRGFPSAANTGLQAAAGRDVVLLNSDTEVPAGWLERLRAAAYSAPEVGTATPLSNDGTIVSVGAAEDRLDPEARAANSGLVADIPVGVGFCLFIRRDCLDQVGALREDLFAQGYGEESEFCMRARACGWRHVAALDVFVAHRGGQSFGAGRGDLRRRNQAILERWHPSYRALVAAHLAEDPLFPARRRIGAARWAAACTGAAVVLVSHGAGGGVAELVAARAAALREEGVRPVVLVPAEGGCRVEDYEDLRFAVPGELPALAALLRDDGVRHMEVHHLLGHDHGVIELARLLGVPVESWVHDAASFCPRIALIGRGRRYCGEPPVAACVACVAELGSNLQEEIGVEALVARSAADFAASRRVVAPTADTARRVRRHFPGVRVDVVGWEPEPGGRSRKSKRSVGGPTLTQPSPASGGGLVVCVVGAIGVEKGYDVLLGCAEDAARRGLGLEFVVCGHTEDDERLMAAGPVFVTGRYAPEEAVGLIRAQGAQLAFIPSIWPETWCFALSRVWEAGLEAVAFDLGAPAERIRARRRGHLLPLGLPVERVNDALLRLAPVAAALQP